MKDLKGTVKFWSTQKAFGFLTETLTGKEYFVHISGINNGETLNENDEVTFDLAEGRKPGLIAVNVTLL